MTLNEIHAIIRNGHKKDWSLVTFGDTETSLYEGDVNLRVEVSYNANGTHNCNFKEMWANQFPDPSAASYYAKLYYGYTLIKTYILVSVDGSRAMMPLPDRSSLIVPKECYFIASIFDRSGTLDEYIARGALTVT